MSALTSKNWAARAMRAGAWLASVAKSQIVMTPGARDAIPVEEMQTALARHAACEWGDLACEDKSANEEALIHGDRVLSSYRSAGGVKFWILTEAADDDGERSATTVLLPEEY